jgi:DNA replication protein DnaC
MELAQSKADGTYSRKLKSLAKLDMLVLDDWGLEPLKAAQRNDLMEIMDDRHGSSSTVLISQLPTDQWYQSIGDNTLADAILDRLMHNAHRIKLKGESMRKKLADVDVT